MTITNQGAGYASAPVLTFINDPREAPNLPLANSTVTQGANASAVVTLTGAQTITGVLCLDHGQGGQTALPTLAFSGGGGSAAAATVIMDWTITAVGVGTAGAGLSGTFARVSAEDGFSATASAYVNPATQSGLVNTRSADARITVTAGAIATPVVIFDGGIYTSVPTPLVIPNASVVTTAPVATLTMGGVTDVTYIQQT